MAMPSPSEEAIFNIARHITAPDARRQYLEQACGDDAVLAQRVLALLAVHENGKSFMARPAAEEAVTAQVPSQAVQGPEDAVGRMVGDYKLLQQIGEGGMGTVYMAEQVQPVQRKVAVKIIKSGMDNKQIIARFEAERQALALMDHPNIARVLDAGTIPLQIADCRLQIEKTVQEQAADVNLQSAIGNLQSPGRPYFVMELVKGVPITQYCEDHHLPPRERLELFIPVCQAVQHAHQKGIIHRDLKPSNVLIALYDGRPVPKIIDFGVAKAMGPRLTDRTLFTEFGAIIGTLEYMSPEQAELNQLDVDTRSDIYALGVLLYELLTGTTPVEHQRVKETAMLEVLRIIREEEPPRPSTRLSRTRRTGTPGQAAAAAIVPPRFDELDWIVMKCLEKDRNRRYHTANGLAMDLERYLADEAVLACPPSAGYRLRKFARRHKAAVITVLAVVASLLVAVVALGVSAMLIKGERDEKAVALDEKVTALAQAEKANEQAKWRLYRSLVAQARAIRRSRGIGQRFDCLAKVAEAAAIARDLGLEPDDLLELRLELRNEAIACLALPDLRPVRDWQLDQGTNERPDVDGALELYAEADRQGNIRVRRVADHSEIVRFASGLGDPALAFSPDGRYLGVWDLERASVWEVGPKRARHILSSDLISTGPVFSSDSRHVAIAFSNTSIDVYDLASAEKPISRLTVKEALSSIAYHPFEPQLAVGLQSRIAVMDEQTGMILTELSTPSGSDYLTWHSSGKRLAAAGYDRIVHIWDLPTRREVGRLEGFKNGGNMVTFNHAGTLVASQGWESKLRLWNVRTGEMAFQTVSAWGFRPRFSTDDRLLVDRRDDRIRLWEVASDREFRTLALAGSRGIYTECSVCPKNERLLAAAMLEGIGLWDLLTGEPVALLAVGRVSPVHFDATGALLTDIDGTTPHRFPLHFDQGSAPAVHIGPPQAIALLGREGRYLAASTNGRVVASGQRDGALVWHADEPDKLVRLTPHTGVRAIAVSGDGRFVATGGHGPVVKVWDARTGKVLKSFDTTSEHVAFSPDQPWLLIGGRPARLWNVDTWRAGPTLGEGYAAAFSPDSRYAALESGEGAVRLVDVNTGHVFARLEDPNQERARAITFSPDGTRLLLTSLESKAIHVWDLRAIRQELSRLELDWDQPAFAPVKDLPAPGPLHVTVDLGSLAPKEGAKAPTGTHPVLEKK
jgi:serine/threonine protein kinase/WD40 repeat protein